jgi:monoamine oxidase
MKKYVALAIVLMGISAATSEAAIYQYTDENGQIHYTNDLSSVPAEKLNQVTEIEETESEEISPAPAYSGAIYPLLRNSQSESDKKRKREQAEKKARLQAEYETLRKEKEALDNDASFQKRRNKRKYQNRPYIKELIAREAEIQRRLKEIEQELKMY